MSRSRYYPGIRLHPGELDYSAAWHARKPSLDANAAWHEYLDTATPTRDRLDYTSNVVHEIDARMVHHRGRRRNRRARTIERWIRARDARLDLLVEPAREWKFIVLAGIEGIERCVAADQVADDGV